MAEKNKDDVLDTAFIENEPTITDE